MSDGDNATPGPGRASHARKEGDANQWLTRTPRPSFAAAPWERSGIFGTDPPDPPDPPARNGAAQDPRPAEEDDPGSGNHAADSSGVSVADLIAKVGGVEGRRTSRHRAEPEPPSRLPLVEAETTILPATLRVPPARIGKPRARPDRRAKRKRHLVMFAGRVAAALIALIALAMTGGAYQWQASKNARLNTISALDPNSHDIKDPSGQYGDENFLIVGVDSRAGENGDMGAGNTQDAGGARSDTVILVNIPASRKRVVAISFPRDLAITPMQCQAWDSDTGKYGPVYDDKAGSYGPDQVYTETKLNSAYAFGGPKCLVKVIQKLSGLSINRFMAIDFAGFAKMVDAMGGVEVCSTTPIQDYELGTVLEKAGRQVLDGRTALNYVRARQVTTEVNGDYGRIKRQQLFLSSLLRAMISRDVLFSMRKLNNVVNTFISDSYVDNVQTKDLVDLGQSLQGIAAGRVTFLTVPTGQTDSDGNEPLRADDNRALFDAIINDDPLPGENNANATTTPTTAKNTPEASSTAPSDAGSEQTNGSGNTTLVDAVTTEPQTVTVRVSNSTGEDGLAATAADELRQDGFNVLAPDDYPSSLKSTTVLYSSGNEQAAATVASSFADAQMEKVSGRGDVVQVVLGPDFANVTPPAPSGSPVKVHVSESPTSPPTPLPADLSVTNGADTTCK
jgi:LCP family protein required for cell wall assembly